MAQAHPRVRTLLGTLLLGAALGPVQAALINVDFSRPVNAGTVQSGAAVLGTAGDVWNNAGGSSGIGIALVDATGAASGATLSYAATQSFDAPCPAGSAFCGTSVELLMRDYLYVNSGVTGVVTLGGLSANSSYELVLYGAANLNRERFTRFSANGVSETAAYDGTTGTLVEGISYVDITTFADPTGTITISFTNAGGSDFAGEGNLNGLQLRPLDATTVPEPSTLLLATGALALIAQRRRRRA